MKRDSTQYRDDEEALAAQMMIKHGGSFAANIGRAYFTADQSNRDRLTEAFADLFDKYIRIAGAAS